MALRAFVAPILPGKTERWKQFANELNGPRRDDYVASRQKYKVHERAFLQQTPHGDVVIVTLEGENPAEALRGFLTADDPFGKWFAAQVKEIHGLDANQIASMPLPELMVDSQQARARGT